MRLARQFESAEGRDLGAFLRFAAARTARGQRESLAATEAEDHDGVRIMTIHAAKGLEFETVAVADLGRGAGQQAAAAPTSSSARPGERRRGRRRGARRASACSSRAPARGALTLWDYERLKHEAAIADAEEELRLTYVAMTRAREHLLLSASFDDEGPGGRRDDRPLGAQARSSPSSASPARRPMLELGEMKLAVRVNRASARGRRPTSCDAPPRCRWRSRRAAGQPSPAARPVTDVPVAGHLSYAALADYERCGYRFYAERVLGLASLDPGSDEPAPLESDETLGEADLTPAAARGRAPAARAARAPARLRKRRPRPARVERAQPLGAARRGSAARRCCARRASPADEGEVDRALALVGGWLDSDLRASLAGARVRLRPEAPFLLALGGSVVRGKMDLVASCAERRDRRRRLQDRRARRRRPRDARRAATRLSAASTPSRRRGWAARRSACAPPTASSKRPTGPSSTTFDAAALDAARAAVERLIAGVRAARLRGDTASRTPPSATTAPRACASARTTRT